MFDDVPLASCLEAHCTVLLPHLAPGKHTMTLTFFDTDNLLVSSVGYALNVPLVDAMARNVAAHAHGGSALAAFSQEQFDVSRSIDGVATGHANGWAYHGRLHEAEAMYRFSAKSRVRRVVLLSGVGRPDHPLPHAMIYYSTPPDPAHPWFGGEAAGGEEKAECHQGSARRKAAIVGGLIGRADQSTLEVIRLSIFSADRCFGLLPQTLQFTNAAALQMSIQGGFDPG